MQQYASGSGPAAERERVTAIYAASAAAAAASASAAAVALGLDAASGNGSGSNIGSSGNVSSMIGVAGSRMSEKYTLELSVTPGVCPLWTTDDAQTAHIINSLVQAHSVKNGEVSSAVK